MRPKDIGIFVLLIVILVVLFLIYKKSKMYDNVLTAVAVKTGAISAQEKKTSKAKISKSIDSNEEEEGEEEGLKPIKLNPVQKQIISLFEDGLPKTTKQIKEAYNEKFKKSLDNVKFNNSITNMRQSGAMLSEKVDGTNYWGPEEWFEEEGDIFLEEYANKVPDLANKDLDK